MKGDTDPLTRTANTFARMREYAHWKDQRDTIIREALAQDVPVERIAAEMAVSKTTVHRVKTEGERNRG